jgi:hypothetical protein
MSTLAVNTITNAAGANTAQINGMTPTADSLQGFRNRLINGDMRIAQRGTAAVTTNGAYPVDRFQAGNNTDGAFTAQQDASAPAGFVNSVKFTTTTADATLTTTQSLQFQQKIEGTNFADLGWGTAAAQTVTLSFWVRSSLTGTFGGAVANDAVDRSYVFAYSISAADTWEYKTVTIPGDTTGTWLKNTETALRLYFGLGQGPDRQGTAGVWAGSFLQSVTGAVSVIGTLGATWYITGVQLEAGSVATPFERRPYGTELQLAQRYFETSYFPLAAVGTPSTNGYVVWLAQSTQSYNNAYVSHKASKRTAPTMVVYSPVTGTSGKIRNFDGGADVNGSAATGLSVFGFYGTSDGVSISVSTTVGFHYTASAEL